MGCGMVDIWYNEGVPAGDDSTGSERKPNMDNIVNHYSISFWIEVCVCEDAGRRVFVVVNIDNGTEEEISEAAAKVMCISSDSTITEENWEDFCTARGIFAEDV